ncbi:hypothetical protein [uncultured Microbulbifer sp.]|uniref:hypothetical protein n=1 Tax=uncultured Microbulbifer sp. TaxID=348147 RepID=UPI002639EF98|nr:hypothetical protein [uncultured Microbulbifer sp.]
MSKVNLEMVSNSTFPENRDAMKITIMYRGIFHCADPWIYFPMEIEVSSYCPKCSGPRGKPEPILLKEQGEVFIVHYWDNPCGHRDQYEDLFFEYQNRLKKTV